MHRILVAAAGALALVASTCAAIAADFKKGDTLVVTKDGAELTYLNEAATALPKGTEVKVVNVYPNRVAVTATVNGKKLRGYLNKAEVGLPDATDDPKEPGKTDKLEPDDPKAVAALEESGAKVQKGEDGNIVLARAWGGMVTDEYLDHLTRLPSLEHLTLDRAGITGKGIAKLAKLKRLKSLAIINCQITPDLLKPLKDLPSLENLDLYASGLKDQDADMLKDLTKLKSLDLADTQITDAGMLKLKNMADLRRLRLSETQITVKSFDQFKNFKKLEWLNISRTRIPVQKKNLPELLTALKKLSALKELRYLELRDNQGADDSPLTDKDREKLTTALENVEVSF